MTTVKRRHRDARKMLLSPAALRAFAELVWPGRAVMGIAETLGETRQSAQRKLLAPNEARFTPISHEQIDLLIIAAEKRRNAITSAVGAINRELRAKASAQD